MLTQNPTPVLLSMTQNHIQHFEL